MASGLSESGLSALVEAARKEGSTSRRQFFVGLTSLGASAALGASGDAAAQSPAATADARLTIGDAASGPPSRLHPNFVKDVGRLTDLNPTNQGGAYWNFDTYITPVEDFYIRNAFPTPRPERDRRVDPRFWRLKVHGDAVERELELTFEDLLKLPSRSIMSTMQCAGNGRTLFWEQQDFVTPPTRVAGNGWGLGGVGLAEWEYVPISHILDLVGVKPTAKAVLFWSGVDGKEPNTESDTGRPTPFEEVRRRSDVIGLAFKMNGKPLPADHGAPVRALVPGWCGGASTKWLTEIKIASHDFWVRLNTFDHVNIGPDYPVPVPAPNDEFRFTSRETMLGTPVTWHGPRSFLTVPLVLDKQPDMPSNYPLARGEVPTLRAGAQLLRGYALAPKSGVARVDVRMNGGGWEQVRIIDPQINPYTWVRFEVSFNAMPGEALIETRVTASNGDVQTPSVPFNRGGYDNWSIPRFKMRFA